MKLSDIAVTEAMQKLGRVAYVVTRGERIETRTVDDLALKQLSSPPSIIGSITMRYKNEQWPHVNELPMMPLIQISKASMPHKAFKSAFCLYGDQQFGDATEVVTICCPQSPCCQEGKWLVDFKTYGLTRCPHRPCSIPIGVAQESQINFIVWEEVTDYPHYAALPSELAKLIMQKMSAEAYQAAFPTHPGTKVGGYSSAWQQLQVDHASKYVMQIKESDFATPGLFDGGLLLVYRSQKTGEWSFGIQPES